MYYSCSIRSIIIPIDAGFRESSNLLINKLIQFTKQHYHIENTALFVDTIVRPEQTGDIIAFYSDTDELVGYTRIYQQKFTISNKPITIYSSNTYNNQTHNINPAAARLGLIQTMKYKLSHPEEDLVHFSIVSSPTKYQFLARLSNTIYPKPNTEVPNYILDLADVLKENNNWVSSSTHPMIIGGQLSKKHQPIINNKETFDDPLTKYYMSLNPNYASGNALLVCIPLNLKNIGYSIRQILTVLHEQAHLDHPMNVSEEA
jgi:hypothetical protein